MILCLFIFVVMIILEIGRSHMNMIVKTIIALVVLAHPVFGGEPVKKVTLAVVNETNNFPANYSYAGWRGGIGVAFGQPAANIPDITELGLNIVWGGEDPQRAAMLDIAVFHYWNSVVEISLKDPEGRYDFSQIDDKGQASKLAFDKFSELRYGIPGLSKYAKVKYSPGGAYGDVYGEMDLSSNNPLVKAVVASRLESLTGSGQKHGGIAMDNAGKVPGPFLEYLQNALHPEGFGIATNGGSEHLYRYIDFFGNEGFPFSQQTMNNMQSKGFNGILGEFVTRQLSSGELEKYLKAKHFNGIVYFGYTDGRDRAAATHYSFFHCRPDIYDHQRWVLRKILPLSKAMFCAGPQNNACAQTLFNKERGGMGQVNSHQNHVDATGRVIEPDVAESDKDDIFGGTLLLDGSIKQYGNDINKGVYLYINSNEPGTIECNADSLGIKANTIVFDEFSGTTLKSKKKGDAVRFNAPSGPALIQLGDTKTVVGNILLRISEMFGSQLLQRQMDGKLGLGYSQKYIIAPPTGESSSKADFDKPLKPWEPFCQGYIIDLKTKKSGRGSLRTDGNTYSVYSGQWLYHNRQGAAQFVTLDQSKPVPLTLTAFSKSENVQKSELKSITETNRRDHLGERLGYYYAMHLYLDYQDGSWPEVHTFAFSPGTHDWEEGEITVVPKKAVKTAMVLVELHQPEGTAWFDDFSLIEKTAPERNLLASSDFGDFDILLDKTKAPEYDKKVARLLSRVNEVQQQISINKLEKLEEEIKVLKGWLVAQGITKMYGREMRDLVDAQQKLRICRQLLKK